MKKVLLVIVVVAGVALSGWTGRLPTALQASFDEYVGPLVGRSSREFATVQTFATAMVRGDLRTVGTTTDAQAVKDAAGRAYMLLRRDVRDVLQVAYRADSARRSADGKTATLEISQGLTLDPPGVTSAFGTMTCEGRYEVTLEAAGGTWKITSLTITAPTSEPSAAKYWVVPAKDVRWPCADSAWTKFSTAWKSTVMK